MVVLQTLSNGEGHVKNKNKNKKASWPNVDKICPKKPFCGSTAGSDMLLWLKGLALDPCEPVASKDSVQKFWYQTLKLREVWHSSNAECYQRKRKLEQCLNGGKSTAASGLASKNSDYQNVKEVICQKTVRNSSSSDSALTFDNCLEGKQLPTDSNTSDNITSWDPFTKDISSLIDTNEPFNDSNPFNPENFIVQDQPLVDSSDLISISHSSSSEDKDKLKQVVNSLSAGSESGNENPPRAVIPIGPKFQAEVPAWIGPVKKECLDDLESLKWLGSKIWPIEEASRKSNIRRIGRRRPQFCSCVSPGTADCIRCLMLSARHDLQSELGPAFFSWKFDEMGEVVSEKWTLKEQMKFEALAKTYLLSNRTDFWECALKHFPFKSRKMILSYYYNVFNPRRMSRLTRSSFDQIDSDEDQVDDKYL